MPKVRFTQIAVAVSDTYYDTIITALDERGRVWVRQDSLQMPHHSNEGWRLLDSPEDPAPERGFIPPLVT